jgi:hypothetical protein
MILRARWTGALPVANEYLMSQARPRFAYRIVAVEQLRDLPHHVPGYARLKLEVEKIPTADVPAGAVVHPWRWDPRKKTGFAWSSMS